MRTKSLLVAFAAMVVALLGWSCNDEPEVQTPVAKPTIGIMEPEFNAETMEVSVMIAPSTDATAWYWRVKGGFDTLDETFTKVEGAAAQEIKFEVTYGVEYTISAYAENKGGESDVASKKFCPMPDGEVSITIGDITLDEQSLEASATIYPSKLATAWYWGTIDSEDESAEIEWTMVEGNTEQEVTFTYAWGKHIELRAYAVCGAIESEVTSKECYFTPSIPTIAVSKPLFDEATMTVSFEVTPSEDTDHWYWGEYSEADDAKYNVVDGAEGDTVIFDVVYDKEYRFIFRAQNAILEGEEKIVDFAVISPVVDIAIENLTAYTLDAVITKREHCVKYVAGAVHTEAYDRNVFVEQAQSSLNPDPSYPFAVFNSATESCTFSEQDLVRNSRTDSDINAGIMLLPNTSYTIAVYGEDAKGRYTVTTKEITIPEVEINGTTAISVEVTDIDLTSAKATVTTEVGTKVLTGFIDPATAKADTDNPFDFEGKSESEIKSYLASTAKGVPMVYSEPFTYTLSDLLTIDSKYVAYAIAIKDGKVGEVTYAEFKTLRPSLTGVAKITAATIEPQTTHETLTVQLSVDANAEFVRVYAAPATDHAAYANNLEYILDADEYQNYREEYDIVDGQATANIDIYHPGSNYYIYASAVDANGRAGEMVCVATLAGLDTEYYTTIEEIEEVSGVSFNGTGTVEMVITIYGQVDDRISLSITTDTRSANAEKVWLIRYNGMISEIEDKVKYAFTNYPDGKILGAYKEAKVGYPCKYEDGGSSWDPKYEALQEYDNTWGGDIIVAVVLDTDGKLNIYSYYAAGREVMLY